MGCPLPQALKHSLDPVAWLQARARRLGWQSVGKPICFPFPSNQVSRSEAGVRGTSNKIQIIQAIPEKLNVSLRDSLGGGGNTMFEHSSFTRHSAKPHNTVLSQWVFEMRRENIVKA